MEGAALALAGIWNEELHCRDWYYCHPQWVVGHWTSSNLCTCARITKLGELALKWQNQNESVETSHKCCWYRNMQTEEQSDQLCSCYGGETVGLSHKRPGGQLSNMWLIKRGNFFFHFHKKTNKGGFVSQWQFLCGLCLRDLSKSVMTFVFHGLRMLNFVLAFTSFSQANLFMEYIFQMLMVSRW